MSVARVCIVWFLLVVPVLAGAQERIFSTSAGAINGYDPVAYFTEGKPVKGLASFQWQWRGATWHFASQQHLDAFKASPEKYAPQYGGYCAFGTSRNYKAPTQADAWTLVDGKLYLNYNLDVRKEWSANRQALIGQADKHWVELEHKK